MMMTTTIRSRFSVFVNSSSSSRNSRGGCHDENIDPRIQKGAACEETFLASADDDEEEQINFDYEEEVHIMPSSSDDSNKKTLKDLTVEEEEWDERVYQSMMKHRACATTLMEYKQLLDTLYVETRANIRKQQQAGTTNLSKIVVGIGMFTEYPKPLVLFREPSNGEGQEDDHDSNSQHDDGKAAVEIVNSAIASDSQRNADHDADVTHRSRALSPESTKSSKQQTMEEILSQSENLPGADLMLDQSMLLSNSIQNNKSIKRSSSRRMFGCMKRFLYGQMNMVMIQEELLRRQLAKKRHDEWRDELLEYYDDEYDTAGDNPYFEVNEETKNNDSYVRNFATIGSNRPTRSWLDETMKHNIDHENAKESPWNTTESPARTATTTTTTTLTAFSTQPDRDTNFNALTPKEQQTTTTKNGEDGYFRNILRSRPSRTWMYNGIKKLPSSDDAMCHLIQQKVASGSPVVVVDVDQVRPEPQDMSSSNHEKSTGSYTSKSGDLDYDQASRQKRSSCADDWSSSSSSSTSKCPLSYVDCSEVASLDSSISDVEDKWADSDDDSSIENRSSCWTI